MPFTQPKLSDKEAQHREKMVLGAILIDPSNMVKAAREMKPAFFRITKNRIIYMTILDLHRSYTPINMINLGNALTKKGAMAVVGGVAYLTEIVAFVEKAALEHNAAAIRAGVRQAGGKA